MEHLKGKYDKLIFFLTICSLVLLFFARWDFWLNWFSIFIAIFLCFVAYKGDYDTGKSMFISISLYCSRHILQFFTVFLKRWYLYMDSDKIRIIFGLIFHIALIIIYKMLINNKADKKNLTIILMILFGVNILFLLWAIKELFEVSTLKSNFRYVFPYLGYILFFIIHILYLYSHVYSIMNKRTLHNKLDDTTLENEEGENLQMPNSIPVSDNYERVSPPYFSEDQTPQPQQPNHYEKIPHPYHQLGGWLKFFVWSIPIVWIILAILYGSEILRLMKYIEETKSWIDSIDSGAYDEMMREGKSYFTMLWLAIGMVIIFAVVEITQISMKIKEKNPIFLKRYVQITIFNLVGYIILFFFFSFDSEDKIDFIYAVISAIVWYIYFTKSVRVRTYMGSDEYLRLCPLSKNTPSPIPADIKREF